MSVFQAKIEGVPQFVSYFEPVHQALLHFDGQATARQVYDHIAEHGGLTGDDLVQVNQNGRPTFENRAAWARFYMTKAGWMYSPKRGVWALTELGKQSESLSEVQAVALFKRRHLAKRLPRQVLDQVRDMKPGDRIAIKAAFVRKHGIPFDNRGRSVSAMKIKAVGTVTRNHGDGRTVDVEWEPQSQPKEWYFYTYRSTITRARVEDEELARRLVSFVFEGAPQDYGYFMAQPYWRDRFQGEGADALSTDVAQADDDVEELVEQVPEAVTYGISDIVAEGCFVAEAELAGMLKRWTDKKNLILQGPPGTGKTWLAKRLAKALIGKKEVPDEQLRVVQFHPSLSYEDFVRGYRPGGDGRLVLTDGLFLQVVEAARVQPDVDHVLIIEEINRGNPAQVLGEMLTLLESSKRSRVDAMELAYRKAPGEKVYVPENLYVIGTMNLADRSLALVDLALRRRFAFVTLAPSLNAAWSNWCEAKGVDAIASARIKAALDTLNQKVASDRALGPQFQVGHSYVTPHSPVADAQAWFNEVVHSEIGLLLHEYWFDTPERADEAIEQLLKQA